MKNWQLYNGTNNGYDFYEKPKKCIVSLWRLNSTGWQETDRVNDAWLAIGSSSNFTRLDSGLGYWAEVNSSCNFTIIGKVNYDNISVGLNQDWSIVGWNYVNISQLYEGSEPPYDPITVDPIDSVQDINKYDTGAHTFEATWHWSGYGWTPSDNPDFVLIEPGIGYYFETNQSAIWNEDANT
jgi:hypothetical protein